MNNNKIYKVRLERNEYQAIKIISCSNNIRMQELMEVIILKFIEYQTPNETPIRRKTKFDNPHVLNVPITPETHEILLRHRDGEGVSIATILNNSVTYWLDLMNVDTNNAFSSIDREEIFKDFDQN